MTTEIKEIEFSKMPIILSIVEMEAILGMTRNAIYRAMERNSGSVPAPSRKEDGKWKWKRDDVKKWYKNF